MKTKTLHMNVTLRVAINYSDDELVAAGKTFREFKAGLENLVAAEAIPVLQADPDTEVDVLTIGWPSSRTIGKPPTKREKKIAKIMNPANFKKDTVH